VFKYCRILVFPYETINRLLALVGFVAKKSTDKIEIRGYVPKDLDKLVRSIAVLKSESLSAVVEQALELWVNQDDQLKIRERHRLDDIEE
jgi:DNA polymerase elongation subunit (family B)